MKKAIFMLKVALVVYLATQAFADYDLIALLYKKITGADLKTPLGINITNTFSFLLAAIFITTKEVRRSKRIGYYFSPETMRHLESHAASDAKSNANDFGHSLDESMRSIVSLRFPPMIPLQLSDILTTQGFELQKESAAEGVLKYVEELSPLEVATNAILSRLRQGTLARQFKLELHHKEKYAAVSINSGNPDTDSYLCIGAAQGETSNSPPPQLASEAAIRMFFESESQICRNFEAFSRFYRLVEKLPASYRQYGSPHFDAIQKTLIEEIDEILRLDPRFLTMKVLKGIVSFHQRNKSSRLLQETQTLFLETIANAREYNALWKRARKEANSPNASKKTNAAKIANQAPLSRETRYYVQGLSELFLGRIFAQSAHRFGVFDSDSRNYISKLKKAQKQLRHGIRLLGAARARYPLLARFNPLRRARIPLAYQTLGLIYHCHDFYDKNEVYYRNPKRRAGVAHSVKDLKNAVKIYSKGLTLCKKRIRSESPAFALHSSTRIHNNLGYARLYSSLIHCKLEKLELRAQPDFARAEFDLLFSGFETDTFSGYPLANLGLLYAMEGQWELSWKAGIAALDHRIYDKVKERRGKRNNHDALDANPSETAINAYRSELETAIDELAIQRPTLGTLTQQNWSYIEGISELSYGFLLRGLCESETREQFLCVGLEIHKRALKHFIYEEIEKPASIYEGCMDRFKNILTNFIRMYWHFDDRKHGVRLTPKLDRIHERLHAKVTALTQNWETNNPSKIELEAAVTAWLETVKTELNA